MWDSTKICTFLFLVLLPCAEQRVDLVDEDDGGLVHPRHSEQGANHLLPLAYPLAELKKSSNVRTAGKAFTSVMEKVFSFSCYRTKQCIRHFVRNYCQFGSIAHPL